MTHCHALTVASRTLERRALEMGLPPEAVYYVPNGVTTRGAGPNGADGARVRAQWELGDGSVLLLFTRFFEFEAGRVIDVLRRVFSEERTAQLLLVGEGLHGEEERFLSLAEDAGLLSHIRWAGWVDGDSLRDYFAAADLAICPLKDSLLNRARCPAKLVDLLAAGLAVVADDVGEVGGYVEHLLSGYLVSPGDAASFAGGVVRLLGEDGLRSRLGEEARRHVSERFDWSTMAAVVERAYST
jgi:glycosyltransferase involved in cell wall biosynthesis